MQNPENTTQTEVSTLRSIALEDTAQINDLLGLASWQAEYQQLSKGKFRAEYTVGIGLNLRISHLQCNRTMLGSGAPPEGHLSLLLPIVHSSHCLLNGAEFGDDQVGLVYPNSTTEGRFGESYEHITMILSYARLQQAMETLGVDADSSMLGGTKGISITSIDRGFLISNALQAQKIMGAVASPYSYKQLQIIEDALLSWIALFMSREGGPPSRQRGRQQRLQHFRRARDFIEANLGAHLGLERLSEESGSSLRTLRSSFQEVLGVNPQEYIKVRRLSEVRRRLMRPDPDVTSVTDVAFKAGFTHMGNFARDYRALFGEYPNETLRQPQKHRTAPGQDLPH